MQGQQELAKALLAMFTPEQFVRLVRDLPDAEALTHELPQAGSVSPATWFDQTALLLRQHGFVDEDLFSALIRARPRREPELRHVRQRVLGTSADAGGSPASEYDPARAYVFIPFRPKGDRMVGRDAGVARVREQLDKGRPTAIGQTAAFTGIGGIGKTQLAVEYAHEYAATYPGGVYWFTADQDIESQLLRLSDEARWLHPSSDAATKLQVARHRLAEVPHCLFVFDNVEDRRAIDSLLPDLSRRCHVLLTSRTDHVGFVPVAVSLLGGEQARALLLAEAGRVPENDDDDRAVDRICDRLAGLPLALELAGAYLNHRPTRTFREYADLLARKGIEATGLSDGTLAHYSATGHEANLASTLTIAGALLKDHPDLESALDLFAWSASASIGWDLLVAGVAPADEDKLRDGIDLAAALHVLQREDGGDAAGGPRFRMHRLVQEVRQAQRPVHSHAEAASTMVARISAWFEGRRRDFADLAAFEAEFDHLDAWRAAAETLELPAEAVRLRWLRAYPAWHRGKYKQSLEELESAIAGYTSASIIDPCLRAHLLNDRGVLHQHLRHLEDALRDHLDALAIRRECNGERHADTAQSYGNLGESYRLLKDVQAAIAHQRTALDIRVSVLGESHPESAESYVALACAYGSCDEREQELQCARRALKIRLAVLGEAHPDTANSYEALASAYSRAQEHEQALDSRIRAHRILETVLGASHPRTAATQANLGGLLFKMGDFRQALPILKRAFTDLRGRHGLRHEDTLYCSHLLLLTLNRLGRRQEVFALANELVHGAPRTAPQYRDFVRAYNDCCPAGVRALPPEGPHGGKAKKARKKRR